MLRQLLSVAGFVLFTATLSQAQQVAATTAIGQQTTLHATQVHSLSGVTEEHDYTMYSPTAVTSTKTTHWDTEIDPGTTSDMCKQSEIEHAFEADPEYRAARERADEKTRMEIDKFEASTSHAPPPVYTIPVVFHVIHKGEAVGSGTNISDAQLLSAIDALNRDYRRTADDGGIAQGAGPDTEIQFCLASRDPSGNPTTGINRVNGTSVSNYSSQGIIGSNETAVKDLSRWDNRYYLNIWVVSEIDNNGADLANPASWGGGTLGYAYLPTSPVTFNSARDGIVAVNLCVGNDPTQSLGYRLWPWGGLTNRTLTHEVGHHLNLYHTFEGMSCSESSCSTQGDLVCDTPPTIQSTNCSSPACGGTQQVENYMDYTGESCIDMFSSGQTTRMRACLSGVRNELVTTANCTPVNNWDASITTINYPTGTVCATSIAGEVVLQNLGANTLTSVDIIYDIDGLSPQTYPWTGSLTTSASEVVTLPAITTTVGAHTYNATVDPNTLNGSNVDANMANDGTSSGFSVINGNNLTLTILADAYGSETTWEILSGATTVASGGPYADLGSPGTTTYTENLCIADGCYDFVIYDSYGDGICCAYGNGSYDLVEDASATSLASGGTFASSETTNFCVPTAPTAPTADFVGTPLTIPDGSSVSFTDLSVGSPAVSSWTWTITGPGTTVPASPIIGTQNPVVQFNGVGLYTISLDVDNGVGTDNETKVDYVEVVASSGFCDTLRNYSLTETITGFGLTGLWGYYPAHNEIGMSAYADPYTSSGPTNVQAVIVPILANDAGGASTFDLNIYDDNAGEPGTIIGTEVVPYSSVTAGFFNIITMSTPTPVNGDFWVGIELTYNPGDTLFIGTADNRAPGGPSTTYTYYDPGTGAQWEASETIFGGGLMTSLGFDVLLSSGQTSAGFTMTPSGTVCTGTPVNVDGTASTNTTDYFWDLTGGTPATSTNSAETVTYGTAGTYDVKLYTQGGCVIDSLIQTLTVTDGPTLTASVTDATCGSSNGQIDITAPGATQYSIDGGVTWQAGSSFTSLPAGTYDVVVEDATGCQATSVETVSNTGGPAISSTSSNDPVCNASCDGTITITATGATQYSIDGGTTFQASNVFTGLCGGTYDLVADDGSGTCSDFGTVVLVDPVVLAHTTVIIDAGCTPTGQIDVNATGGTPGLQYSNDGGATWQASNSFTGLSAGSYDIVVEDANGCQSLSTVSVGGGSAPSAGAVTIDETCLSGNGQIDVTGTGGDGGPYTYSIDGGTTFQASGTFTGLSAGTYSVVVEDGTGCQGTTTVTIINTGGGSGTVSANQTICAGDPATITSGGGVTYSWDDGSGPFSTNPTEVVNPTATTTYTVTITDGSGCVNVLSTTITVNTAPVTTVSNDTTICAGDPVTLTGCCGTDYFWNTGASTASITVSPTGTTPYTVVASNGSCTGSLATVTVTVVPDAVAVAGSDVTTTYLGSGGTVNFNSTGSIGTVYDWDFGDGNTGTGSSPTHNYTGVGTYTVILCATLNSCVDCDTLTIVVAAGTDINDHSLGNNISIYPNPTNGQLSIGFNLAEVQDVTVTVTDLVGKLVDQFEVSGALNQVVSLDLSTESEGFYMIRINSAEDVMTRRISVIR